LSAAESDIPGHSSRIASHNDDHSRIEAEIRRRPPPKIKEPVQGQVMSSGRSLTDKIDDIFSELTEEIYTADKHQRVTTNGNAGLVNNSNIRNNSSSGSGSSSNGRKLSPVRRVTDPLPNPPVPPPPPQAQSPR
jgi:hypothetical protein